MTGASVGDNAHCVVNALVINEEKFPVFKSARNETNKIGIIIKISA